jgi:hypothetical protein
LIAGLFFGVSTTYVALMAPFVVDSFLGFGLLKKTFRGHSGGFVHPKEMVMTNAPVETA